MNPLAVAIIAGGRHGGGGGGFTPNAAVFDGTNDYLYRTVSLSAVANGKLLTFSCIASFASGSDGSARSIFAQGDGGSNTTKVSISRNASNKLAIFARTPTPAVCLDITGSVNITNASGPVHIFVAVDMDSASNTKIWINGVEDTSRTVTTFTVGATLKLVVNDTPPKVHVGAAYDGTARFSGALKELWLDDVYHPHPEDFATGATPLDIGATGNGPTGNAPALYLSRNGNGNAWAVDSSGNSNNFTVAGALD